QENSNEKARDAWDSHGGREPGFRATAPTAQENVRSQGRESAGRADSAATQEGKYRWRSSTRCPRRQSISNAKSEGATGVRNGRGQRGARSRYGKVEGHQALHHLFLISISTLNVGR